MKSRMARRRFNCGINIVVRCCHTLIVLAVPTTLLFKDTALRACLIELRDPIFGFGYILLLAFSLIMYFMACLVDPGYLPVQTHKRSRLNNNTEEDSEDNDSDSDNVPMMKRENNSASLTRDNMYRYCDYCEIEQPLRAKHCEDCKRCVRKYDHHCPWLEACVGERNHKYFWLFLLSTSVLIIWTATITWKSFQLEKSWQEWFKNNIFFSLDMIVLLFGGLTVFGLLGFHTFLMFRGLTTWEAVSRERITYLKHLDGDFNPFDEGCFKNVYYFLSSCKIRRWEVLYEQKSEVREGCKGLV